MSSRSIGILLLTLFLGVAGSWGNTATEPVAKDGQWLQRHADLVRQAKTRDVNVVFLGDSITEHWTSRSPEGGLSIWKERFEPLKSLNLGISGDRTQHVLWRIAHGALDDIQPKVIVLMIGTNNTGLERDRPVTRNSVGETVAGIQEVVQALRKKLADTKILLLGIFPRGERPDDPQRQQVAEINSRLTDLHDGKQVYFWDIGNVFLSPDGVLSSGIAPDFLHLNEAGYRLWADAIQRPLRALLENTTLRAGYPVARSTAIQTVHLDGQAGGPRFDGIGVVSGGGATAVLLKDYPEPQRSQILDLVYKPKFGASVSALLVEIPGDGNSTQGSMPSHMRTPGDLNYDRGYMWWILREAKKRNPAISLDATAWSAPGWIGQDPSKRFEGKNGDPAFWSSDAVDYYVKWLQGLRGHHGLDLDAIGCRNEKGVSFEFAKSLKAALKANGFEKTKLHAFDNWPSDKLDFVAALADDPAAREAIDILSAHVFWERTNASREVKRMAAEMKKPIWNTEDHVYLKGFDHAISVVQAFNLSFLHSGATKIVNWYDIAGVYPIEPFAEDPAMILARSPWSGHYQVREALWGYAHYGQFSEIGWQYLTGGCGQLAMGGSYVTLKSPANDYSVIIETKEAAAPQQLRLEIGGGLSDSELCVWRSNAQKQFERQPDLKPVNGAVVITIDPGAIYSLSTTRGQQKGAFANVPEDKPFPFPYLDNFDAYSAKAHGYLPRYTADIADVFELVARPDGQGQCLRQAIPIPTISWAPDWQPYSIIGDDRWQDYDVSADVWLNPGDRAGVMGRINHVGTGYGFIPKGYWLELSDSGLCRLVVVRGKPDKKKPVGDAEQQAIIRQMKDESEGGEKVLGTSQISGIRPGQWHRLTLRMHGTRITGLIDGQTVLSADDPLYPRGMAGLLAGGGERLSTPYFDNLQINDPGVDAVPPSLPARGQSPIYSAEAAR